MENDLRESGLISSLSMACTREFSLQVVIFHLELVQYLFPARSPSLRSSPVVRCAHCALINKPLHPHAAIDPICELCKFEGN